MKMDIFSQSDARNFFLHIINSLTPNSRKCSISPHSITAKLNLKVVKMKETIATLKEALDCQNISWSVPKKICGEQYEVFILRSC